MAYWINTISREHVLLGMAGGYTQANHGRPTGLRRLRRGDLMAFYSPRTAYPDGAPLQRFTALARVTDDEPYQVQLRPDFHPFRRRVEPIPADEAAIGPLIDSLDFIRDKRRWGFVFRRGLFTIGEEDFRHIALAMGVTLPAG
jgi:EVE domain